jgi:hypothetical protein
VLASPSVKIDGKSYPIGYNVLMRSGDEIAGNIFGLIHDHKGKVVVEKDGSRFISSDNDFSSLIQIDDKLFNITHFASRPSAMYLTELSQDKATGALTPLRTQNIDFSKWGGLGVPCAGSVTPWNTHLGSEEYPPNARSIEEANSPEDINDDYRPMLRYFGIKDPFDAALTMDEITSAIDDGVRFSDIFDTADPSRTLPETSDTIETPPAGFTSINAYNGDGAAHEFLRLKPGMEKIASRTETRRYAALMGATTEFRKEEGITFDRDRKVLYVAMSEVTRGMEDFQKDGEAKDKYDKGGFNHVRLPYNKTGCVYGNKQKFGLPPGSFHPEPSFSIPYATST